MVFKVIFVAIFLFMATYSFVYIRPSVVRIIACVSYLAGIFFVLNPEVTTSIANFFGIGRGLDFFLIFLQVAIINALIFIIRHVNAQHRSLTKLSRHIAIRESCSPKGEDE